MKFREACIRQIAALPDGTTIGKMLTVLLEGPEVNMTFLSSGHILLRNDDFEIRIDPKHVSILLGEFKDDEFIDAVMKSFDDRIERWEERTRELVAERMRMRRMFNEALATQPPGSVANSVPSFGIYPEYGRARGGTPDGGYYPSGGDRQPGD